MTIDSYFGIGKPEEKTPPSNVDSVLLVKRAFELWWKESAKREKELLDTALCFIEPCEHHFPEVIEDDFYFTPLLKIRKYDLPYASLFYTALLNMGAKERTLVIPEIYVSDARFGYGMTKGLLDSAANSDGNCGGLGICAFGGIVINRGHMGVLGHSSLDGLFINYGSIERDFGFWSEGGLYINYGKSQDMGREVRGGIYIAAEETNSFMVHAKKQIGITKKKLQQDTTLTALVEEIRQKTEKKGIDIEAVRDLGEKIKTHCQQYYVT